MKNLKKLTGLLCLSIITVWVFGQTSFEERTDFTSVPPTTITIDNSTSCQMNVRIDWGDITDVCNTPYTPGYTGAVGANSSLVVNVPGNADPQSVTISESTDPSVMTTVSYSCGGLAPQSTNGEIECAGDPVDVNFASQYLVELSI